MRSKLSFVILLFLVGFGCSHNKNQDLTMVSEFWSLNKDSSFDELADVSIELRDTEYDSKKEVYVVKMFYYGVYDKVLKEYVKFPLYKRGASWDDIRKAYDECDEKCRRMLVLRYNANDSSALVKAYNDFTNRIIDRYDRIRLPVDYDYSNVLQVLGRPNHGLISFRLSGNAEAFFVKDVHSLSTKYLRDFLRSKKKLDDHWYYRIGPN